MIDTSSVDNFVNSLPKMNDKLKLILKMDIRTSKQIKTQTFTQAKRGYIGCLPIASCENEEIVLRLLPGKK